MTTPRITIIGLGLIGGSIGLGIKTNTNAVHIVGHDIDSGKGRFAQKKGMIDKSKINLIDACRDADLVIIATPITAIRETLELIGPHLKRGCVVSDTATLKTPVLEWAAETLPDGVSFVGGDPLLNPTIPTADLMSLQGLESARADLFQGALYLVCAPPQTRPAAVKRVTDMANVLQAKAFFVDPLEHDGMRAAVEGLPALTSLALMHAVGSSPGWHEARKMADHNFDLATASLADDAESNRARVLLNADYLLPRLDDLIQTLTQFRQWMAANESATLEEAIEQAISARALWLVERTKGEWEEELGLGNVDIAGTFGSLSGALGFGLGRRKSKED